MTSPATPGRLPLDATTHGHLPYASWMVGGAFRYDSHLLTMLEFLGTYYPPRAIAQVVGAPPCAWSLEMQGARRNMPMGHYLELLAAYAGAKAGVVLEFDNPLPPADSLEDEMTHQMVKALCQAVYNPTGRNAVCVANDELASCLRARYPRLPIICHPNRLIVETSRRTPAFYEALERKYNRIILHPRDAVSPSIYQALKHRGRYSAVVNDPIPRNYPARRELLHLLAECRRRPWDSSLSRAWERMMQSPSMCTLENTSNLTRLEEAALYEAGIRSYVVQSTLFRNELSFWYSLLYHLLRTSPEHTNRAALITSAAMACIRPSESGLPTGLSLFSSADYPIQS